MEPTRLNVIIDQSAFKLRESTLEHIQKRIEKLDARTRKFPIRNCHISQQFSEREGLHRFVVSLKLPHHTLVGHAEESHLRTAFDRAFKKLIRQLDEFKHMIRREHFHKRNRHLRETMTRPDEDFLTEVTMKRELERFKEGLGEQLEMLRGFVDADVRHIRREIPDFKPSKVDLVEAVLLAALERFPDKPRSRDLKSWLYALALDVVDAKSREHRIPTQDLRPREVQAEIPQDKDDTWSVFSGLESLYVSDNEDIAARRHHRGQDDPGDLEDHSETPDPTLHLEAGDVRGLVERRLTELPLDWRRSFQMHYVDGFNVAEIGKILDLSDEQVAFRLRSSAEFLRDHLEDQLHAV